MKDILKICELWIEICRKRPADASASEFDSAMRNIFQIMMNVSRDILYKTVSSAGVMDESEFEFAEYICESMVSLGSFNFQCISGDNTILSLYLQQVIALPS
jgi:exportin-5